MKKPRKPTEPFKPSIPDHPKETMVVYETRELGDVDGMNDGRFTIADFAINVRARLASANLPVDTLLSFSPDSDWGGEYNGCVTLHAELPKTVPNPHFKKQLTEYKKHEKLYATQREKYQKDLAEYKVKLARYHEDQKAWDEHQKEVEMKQLEERLAILRKETGKAAPTECVHEVFCQEWIERDSWSGPSHGGYTLSLTKEQLFDHTQKELDDQCGPGPVPEYYVTTDGPVKTIKVDEKTIKEIKKKKDGVVWLSTLPGKG